jgi:predicted phosphodiesterase
MRFLLISDTHGRLGIINELAARTRADAVIHAGDLGFYDDGSYERLSERELLLHVAHSDLPQPEKDRILGLPRNERAAAAKAPRLLGDFQSYVDGRESFCVPVYAVWGNHEDKDVVERVFRGDVKIGNLHVLHHRQAYRVGPALIYGLGGNLLPGSKMMQKPIAGGGGRIWSMLSQYADLVRAADSETDWAGLRLFVSHVSPGKEPFVELVGARTGADFTVSGHMGAPICKVWNPFAINSVEGSVKRLHDGLESVRRACLNAAGQDAAQVEDALSLVGRLPEETIHIGRGAKAPRWYRQMTHVNLPDAHAGHAVLDIADGRASLETFVA